MAAKKKTKVTHHRRRRVSGVGGQGLQTIIGLVIGGAGGRMLATSVGANMNPKIISAGKIAAGYFIAHGKHGDLITGVGYGLVADGVTALLQQAGVIHGIDDMPVTIPMAGMDTGFIQSSINGPGQGYVSNMIAGNYDQNEVMAGIYDDGLGDMGESDDHCTPGQGSGLFVVNTPVGLDY